MAKASKRRRAVKQSRASKSKAATKRTGKHKRKAAKTGAAQRRRRNEPEGPSPQEEAAFNEALIESGEAARLDEKGRLPPGATHEIVEDQAGNVKVVRRRFSVS